ncbi:MAG: S24/S26 family peptidase [Clostridia bacterium]|nr:S24/S26 family peptidase [Clostridia bacterium]
MNGKENLESVMAAIRKDGKAFFYTRGYSMLPMLKEGRDISVLVPLDRPAEKGEVVLFVRRYRDDQLVLHRVIRRRDDGTYIIRGDNTYYNEPVKEENVLALLDGFFRKGRYHSCKDSRRYRIYAVLRMFFFPLRKFTRQTLRVAAAKIKNNVFHLNNLHLDDILGRNRSEK